MVQNCHGPYRIGSRHHLRSGSRYSERASEGRIAKSSDQKLDLEHPGKGDPSWKPTCSFYIQATSWWCCGLIGLGDRRAMFSILFMSLMKRAHPLRVLEPEVTTVGSMGRMVITILGMECRCFFDFAANTLHTYGAIE